MRQRLLRNKVSAGVLALAGSVTPVIAQGTSPTATASRHAGRPIIVRIGDRAPRPDVLDKNKTTAEVTQFTGWAGAL
jgi:hypothetical protein